MRKIWTCKIGEVDEDALRRRVPNGADLPMRDAIREAYKEVTGQTPDFIFSGWGGELTEGERAAHDDRMPDHDKVVEEAIEALREGGILEAVREVLAVD